jgi:hypothetical protein
MPIFGLDHQSWPRTTSPPKFTARLKEGRTGCLGCVHRLLLTRYLGHPNKPRHHDSLILTPNKLLDLNGQYLDIIHLLVQELDQPPKLGRNDVCNE